MLEHQMEQMKDYSMVGMMAAMKAAELADLLVNYWDENSAVKTARPMAESSDCYSAG